MPSCAVYIYIMVVTFVIIRDVTAQHSYYKFIHKRPSNTVNKYCGKNLANALQLLCNGVYNSMFKKSDQDMDMSGYPITFSYERPYPFRPPEYAKMMIRKIRTSRLRRESRGVHDECCAKPCSIDELKSYCASNMR